MKALRDCTTHQSQQGILSRIREHDRFLLALVHHPRLHSIGLHDVHLDMLSVYVFSELHILLKEGHDQEEGKDVSISALTMSRLKTASHTRPDRLGG